MIYLLDEKKIDAQIGWQGEVVVSISWSLTMNNDKIKSEQCFKEEDGKRCKGK